MKRVVHVIICLVISACGGGSSPDKSDGLDNGTGNNTETLVIAAPTKDLDIPNNTLSDPLKILLIGNSHTSSNGLGAIIKLLINAGKPLTVVEVERVNGISYLDERINDGRTLEHIKQDKWTHIVLQAQKYSQSGTVLYSTTAAQMWVDIAKDRGATPVLFPEHPSRGNFDEASYVHNIHLSIVEKQKSCIAPIGLGWELVIEQLPELEMHAPDGNHAAYTGSFFTALIFYQVFTDELADSLPYLPSVPLSESIQNQLGKIASQILDEHQACSY